MPGASIDFKLEELRDDSLAVEADAVTTGILVLIYKLVYRAMC